MAKLLAKIFSVFLFISDTDAATFFFLEGFEQNIYMITRRKEASEQIYQQKDTYYLHKIAKVTSYKSLSELFKHVFDTADINTKSFVSCDLVGIKSVTSYVLGYELNVVSRYKHKTIQRLNSR